MKVRKGDLVAVTSGKDKGKQGKVETSLNASGEVVVEGVNVVRKHVKPGKLSKEGGIISINKPIDVSRVMVVCKSCNKGVRISLKFVDGKKVRVCRRCGNAL